jgi:hypothetical protein
MRQDPHSAADVKNIYETLRTAADEGMRTRTFSGKNAVLSRQKPLIIRKRERKTDGNEYRRQEGTEHARK